MSGNRFSTNAAMTAYLPNTHSDLLVEGGEEITIGGNTIAEGNTLLNGMTITRSSAYSPANITVKLNWIGSTPGGVTRSPDTGYGLSLTDSTQTEVLVNKITHFDKGIVISGSSSVLLSKNRVWDNAGIGIDLKNDGPTANDNLDADSGPNGLQNFPQINPVVVKGGPIYFADLSGSLSSKANTGYTIEIFTSKRCDPSGYGEGEVYYGNAVVTTNAAGTATWTKNDILLENSVTCFTATARETASKSYQRVLAGRDCDCRAKDLSAGSPALGPVCSVGEPG